MTQLKSILLKLDGSTYSHVATEQCIEWAKEYGCRLFAISVVNDYGILSQHPEEPVSVTEQRDDRLRQARECADQYLQTFAERCSAAGVSAETCREKGRYVDHILREVQRHDLMVLGRETHFHSTKFPSSPLAKTLHESPRPVITVPLVMPQERNILIAYDGRAPAARALAAVVHTGLTVNRKVHVVAVRTNRRQAEKDTQLATDYLQSHGIGVSAHPIDSKRSVDEVIVPLIGELEAGLLVAGAYGRTRTAEFLWGSVTKKMLKESPVPVFMFH